MEKIENKTDFIGCPVCGSRDCSGIVNLPEQPLSNLSLSLSREESMSVLNKEMNVVICIQCSHIYNKSAIFTDNQYKSNNLTYFASADWEAYSKNLAKEFIEKYRIIDRSILEIGCGSGSFLHEFLSGGSSCVGYDPSYNSNAILKDDSMKIVSEYFTPGDNPLKNYDIVIMRHVAEHLDNAKMFFHNLRCNINNTNNALLFIEVPNISPTLQHSRVNDFVHEHISYFSKYSLSYLLRQSNFNVVEIFETFNNENVVAIATPNNEYSDCFREIEVNINNLKESRQSLERNYMDVVSNKKEICIWGAGGRGSVFLNLIKNCLTGNEVIVDSDARKIDMYVPNIGIKIKGIKDIRNKCIEIMIITTSLGKDNIVREINQNKICCDNIFVYSNGGLRKI
jgi:2-polyprenyl-3-methyl-5-hydroxy-6-metoxy-1,4-benzoquinol methylase